MRLDKKKMWILAVPLGFALCLGAISLLQFSLSTLRLRTGFDLVATRITHILDAKLLTKETRTLILGDSTAFFNLDPTSLDQATSLAASNSTIRESYYTLTRLLAQGYRPNCVVASYSFQWKSTEDYFWSMYVRNKFYTHEELREIYALHAALESTPARGGWIRFWLKTLLYETKLYGDTLQRLRNLVLPDLEKERFKAEFPLALARGRGWPQEDHWRPFTTDVRNFSALPEATAVAQIYVAKMRMLLESHHIRLFLVDLPLADSYSAKERQIYETAYLAAARDLLASAMVKRAPLPPLPEHDFFKAGHLKQSGVAKIMRVLKPNLRECAAGARL